jgi:predicted acyltransferase
MAEDNVNQKRLVSLDALRGFTMFLLIGGGEIGGAGIIAALFAVSDQPWAKALYEQTTYSYWGSPFHVKDFVMPLFIFVVGVAMPYSFAKRISCGDSKGQLYRHVVQRTLILIVLGMIAGGHLLEFDISKFYACNNVLQQIGIGYFVTAMIMLNFGIRGQLTALVALLLGYWALMTLVPVPGHGVVLTRDVNFARHIDDIVLGSLRPEAWGITWAITLPMSTSCTVLLGALAGQVLKSMKSPMAKVGWLAGASVGCLVLSIVWGHWFPNIWEIWTGPWVLLSGGIGIGLLALFYLVIDVLGFQKWTLFFVVIGSNCIALYMVAHLFDFRLLGDLVVGGLARHVGAWSDVVRTLAAFIVIWLIMLWMYRKKSFIKV